MGTSGLLSPFANIKGLSFNEKEEPHDFYYQFTKDLEERYKDKGITYIKLEFENADDFYNAMTDMQKFCDENISISGTSRTGRYEMIINEEGDMDDSSKPSTIALQKKRKKPGSNQVNEEELVSEEVTDEVEEDVTEEE